MPRLFFLFLRADFLRILRRRLVSPFHPPQDLSAMSILAVSDGLQWDIGQPLFAPWLSPGIK